LGHEHRQDAIRADHGFPALGQFRPDYGALAGGPTTGGWLPGNYGWQTASGTVWNAERPAAIITALQV
jgi:hypothetical protein